MPARPSPPRLSVAAALLLAPVAGCGGLGPAGIQNGRSVYNDAIVTTNSQQILELIVRQRYDEPHGLMVVASVTANMRFQTTTGLQFGFGATESYAGNLVPLSVSGLYEENPTISYLPLDGEMYVRQLLSPIPLDLALLMIQATNGNPAVFGLLVRSINGIENPAFLPETGVEVDPRIDRFGEVVATMSRRDWLEWAGTVGENPSYSMLLSGDSKAYEDYARDLLGLLDLEVPEKLEPVVEVPIVSSARSPGEQVVRIRTRSLYDLFQIAAASVDVAPRDLASGLAGSLPKRGRAGESLHIRSSEDRPEQAMVAVQRHGTWYYIDGTDVESKRIFALIDTLMSLRLADTAPGSASGPLLTVPVSR